MHSVQDPSVVYSSVEGFHFTGSDNRCRHLVGKCGEFFFGEVDAGGIDSWRFGAEEHEPSAIKAMVERTHWVQFMVSAPE